MPLPMILLLSGYFGKKLEKVKQGFLNLTFEDCQYVKQTAVCVCRSGIDG